MLAHLGALCACVPFALQSSDLIERSYDLRALETFAEFDATIADPRLPLNAVELSNFEADPKRLPWPSPGFVPDGDWSEVFSELLTPEEAEETSISSEHTGLLVVRAPAEVHEIFETLIAGLEARVLRDYRIEIHLLDPAVLESSPGGVLTREATDAVLSSRYLRGNQTMRGRYGRPRSIEMISRQAFLLNYDVEIAQFASGSDPQVSVLVEGLLGGVHVEERDDGGSTLRLWARWCEAETPMKSITVGPNGEMVQLPVVDAMVAVASADLSPGESLLIGGSRFPLCLLFRVKGDSPATDLGNSLGHFDLSVAFDTPFALTPLRVVSPSPSGGWGEIFREPELLGSPTPAISQSEVLDELNELTDRPFTVLGKCALVRADEQELLRVRERLAEFMPEPVSTFSVELRSGVISIAQLAELESGGVEGHLALLPSSVQGAVRAGDGLTLIGGTERMYVKDYDLQVAQGTHRHEPVLDSTFGGVAAWVRLLPGPDGTVELQNDMRWTEVTDFGTPLGLKEPNTEYPGLSFPRVDARTSWTDQSVPLDEWVQLSTTSRGPDQVQVLYARVRGHAR